MPYTNAEIAQDERYTYGDYRTWDDGLRWELIDGEAFCMTPGPGIPHQSLLGKLHWRLGAYFEGKDCRVYVAPCDVMLPASDEPEDEIDTVVQPDIMIVCDKSKIQHNGIKGAPDVVFEILSPSTTRRDLDGKFALYERSGVREYVIVDPRSGIIFVHKRDAEGRFSGRKIYGEDDVLEFGTFPELKIPLKPVWDDIQWLRDM